MQLETVIGLEIHAQLNTRTKMFCRCDNDAFGAEPNTRVCSVCMGFPGMLPVINQTAIDKGALAAAALGCTIEPFSKFDRKNYFYPDLPTGYQISQYDQPISSNGAVDIEVEGVTKTIGITRLHLENDAGKLSHGAGGTLCDYNRAGTPLAEIVTDPDLRSPLEAWTLAREVQKILRAVNASDADMEKGMMRFDASISLRPIGEQKFYPRTEIKNLNSFQSLLKALKYEEKRQREAWEKGVAPDKETTVGWLDDTEKTQLLRDKESAMDYRYFPEPDLPPVTFTPEQIATIKAQVPELPLDKYKRYQTEWQIDQANALKLTEDAQLTALLESAVDAGAKPKKAANIILSVILAETGWAASSITSKHIAEGLSLLDQGKISSTGLKEIIQTAMQTGKSAADIMTEKNLEQVSDDGQLEQWVDEIVAENPSVIEDIKAGKDKGIQFLMGQVMKKSRGQANPPVVMAMLKEKIG